MKDTGIIINNRNRVTTLCKLVTWFLDRGYENLIVLDNASDYPPLLEYYEQLEGAVNVIRLGKNLMSKALWCWTASRHSIRGPFVYTDSDVVPADCCPDDLIPFLFDVSAAHGQPNKVGLGLRIDNLPDHYSQADRVRIWEGRFWEKQIGKVNQVPVYSAAVDTTFALYPELRPFSLDGIRTGFPYIGEHLPWYIDSSNPTEEELYYEASAGAANNWKIDSCDSQAVKNYCEGKL